MKYVHVYAFFLMSFFHTSCGENQDRNGNSYPSAPLRAGGKSFQHFTTKDGLGSNSYHLRFIYKGYTFIYNPNLSSRKISK